ncbi:MAG TPA: hypothetical protein PLV25_06350 [Opitutales bacterium]|nr:hypothetical protein [Opitutales bacterium]
MDDKRDLAVDLETCGKILECDSTIGGYTGAMRRLIADAPEGWPHAIRRAISAEERVRVIEEVLRFYADINFDGGKKARQVLEGGDSHAK